MTNKRADFYGAVYDLLAETGNVHQSSYFQYERESFVKTFTEKPVWQRTKLQNAGP